METLSLKLLKIKKNVGKVYYDIEDAQFKRIRKTADGFSVEIIDIDTFDSAADEAAKVSAQPKPASGLFGQKSKPKQTFKEAFEIEDKETFDPFGGA